MQSATAVKRWGRESVSTIPPLPMMCLSTFQDVTTGQTVIIPESRRQTVRVLRAENAGATVRARRK